MLGRLPEGGKKLPTGFLSKLAEATGKSQTELRYRRLFAEKVPDRDSFVNTVDEYRSWHEIVNEALRDKPSAHVFNNAGDNEWFELGRDEGSGMAPSD